MGVNDSDQAVALFRQKLNSTDSFFNDAPIPKNETDEEAHKRCSNLMGAETYCPKRWAAMQLWFREARRVGWRNKNGKKIYRMRSITDLFYCNMPNTAEAPMSRQTLSGSRKSVRNDKINTTYHLNYFNEVSKLWNAKSINFILKFDKSYDWYVMICYYR